MCEKCENIDAKIASYRRLTAGLDDQTAIAMMDLAIADLEAEKVKLHPEDE
jgi:hypothetical protein